jgi:hypothetical protein
MHTRLALLGSVALAFGCGSSDGQGGGNLDCAWLEGNNCWKSTTSAAETCLPPSDTYGTFSADNATCTYASGHVVTFTPPMSLPIVDGNSQAWDFTVTAAGKTCLHYQRTSNDEVTFTVGDQTYREGTSGAMGWQVTCPDGTRYANSNALELFGCPNGLDGMPGNAYGDSDTSLSFSLLGTSSSSNLSLFDCRKPD